MRYSNYFIHTLFEVPKEAETPSHILLLRGSYIHPVAAGIYSLLPLGHRTAEKVKAIIRDELDRIGGMEITMPVLNPAELWKKTKRYFDIGQELFRFKDRRDRDFVLAMTHEEVVTDIARQFLKSYRDLPIMLYQIQTKIRDEARPRAGLLRVREFFMKDAYSFHPDFSDLDGYYPRIFNAYLRIFARCGVKAVPIEADTGIMGGTGSHEFMLESPNGEDRFVLCTRCDYRANTEKAVGLKPPPGDPPGEVPPMEKVPTPGIKTIAELMDFFGTGEDRFLKTVAYEADGELVLVAVRGDFAVSATKLANHLKAVHLEMASEDLLRSLGLYGGFLSPVALSGVRLVLDTSVDDRSSYVAGGNEPDVHWKNVVYGRDFPRVDRVDVTEVREGDGCAQCKTGILEIRRGIELGHTFKLGTKYTAENSMDVTYLNSAGEPQRVVMGCYGIGVERLVAAVIEQHHDGGGMILPPTIAPFQVMLTSLGGKPDVVSTAEEIYRSIQSRFEVLYDDRDESPGVKLKDADLLGIPVRVVVSGKWLRSGEVEIKVRKTGEVFPCARKDLEETLHRVIRDLQPSLDGLPYLPE
ncbi:MAG TPA: proline--tRNA ligase [Syntrophobacteraceae bacterium]|nr:proline--tRNA ligase [Syntrophobacteraceae bacterium]